MYKFLVALSMLLATMIQAGNLVAEQQDFYDVTYILDIAWSPGGERIAIAGSAPPVESTAGHGYLSVIDSVTGSAIFVAEPQSAFTSVAWSPDGQQLALGSFDGTVWVVNATNGERINNLFGHASTVTDVDWSSDGSQIISSGNWDKLTIVWDAQRYEEVSRIISNFHPFAVSFSPDDQTIAIGMENGIYLVPSNAQVNSTTIDQYNLIATWVLSLDYSDDGQYIAVGTIAHMNMLTGEQDSASIIIFDTTTNELVQQFESDFGSVTGIDWDPDKRFLYVLNQASVLTVLDVETGEIITSYSTLGTERYQSGGIAFSPFGGRLAVGDILVEPTNQAEFSASLTDSAERTQYDPKNVGHRGSKWCDNGSNFRQNDLFSVESLTESTFLARDGAVRIIVPDASRERLQAIQNACGLDTTRVPELQSAQSADLNTYTEQIQALPAETIPPACAADLIAVAEAIQAQE
jgi:WD40 repeat protein